MITELHDYAQDTKGTIKQETKKHATCFATLLQNELNSDVARFTTNKKNLATLFIARQFRTWIENAQYCYSTLHNKFTFYVVHFTVA